MLKRVLQTIKDHNLIKSGDKLVFGISGGPDSVCLFDILHKLSKKLNFDLILAHVNYNLREEDSIGDKKYVRELAKKHEVPIYVKDVKELKLNDKGIEERARKIRYGFFEEIVKKTGANKIAIAHNKDDNVETIFMFFMRGSGLRGLTGIKYEQGKIIRPMLDCLKKEVLIYLMKNNLKFRVDVTNEEAIYARNKIRQKLIPYVEKEFNPNIKNTLVQNARILKDDYDFIEKQAKLEIKNRLKIKDLSCKNCLKLDEFLKLDKALQRAILRIRLADLRDISFLEIEETLKMLKTAKTGSCRDIKGLRICKEYDMINFRKRETENRKQGCEWRLRIPGKTTIPELNCAFETENVDKAGKISKNVFYIDLDKTGEKLSIRTRKDGDRIYPKGLPGSQKLKDFFINNKISKLKRDLMPLVVNEKNEIVWVAGMRGDRRFEADQKTTNVLKARKLTK